MNDVAAARRVPQSPDAVCRSLFMMELEEDADDVFEVDTITLAPKGKARKRLKTSENWKKVRAKRER
ncbi:hypothetical protein J6590_074711 [Homalodisca vitripennis]|nr:hypothetical protein J6590_074711 [Homalodisca vitripennis]